VIPVVWLKRFVCDYREQAGEKVAKEAAEVDVAEDAMEDIDESYDMSMSEESGGDYDETAGDAYEPPLPPPPFVEDRGGEFEEDERDSIVFAGRRLVVDRSIEPSAKQSTNLPVEVPTDSLGLQGYEYVMKALLFVAQVAGLGTSAVFHCG
jgi:hypothetical protein